MNKLKPVILLVAVLLVAACATTSGGGFESSLNGASFDAADVDLVATESWGKAIKIAEFEPGIVFDGVEAIECIMPYGESAAVWHFSGLEPNQPVEFRMDMNIDVFMSDSLMELFLLPGRHDAELGTWPKPDWVEDFLIYKWVDSVGRFAGSGYPDATEGGWQTLSHNHVKADEKGEVTVMLMINHYTENPPIVYNYFTNPVVTSVGAES